ncbi:MAG TPA: FtsW/RodA/SpoVE family cell cycle protein [Anaerolineaceae bacterium]
MTRNGAWRHFDFLLFGVVILLSIFGVAMIRSAIAGNADLAEHVNRQIIFLLISVVVLLITAYIDYRYWASLTRIMYLVVVVFLMFIFIAGAARFGAARWLDTGLVLIQPAELGKIVIILALAEYFSKTKDAPRNLTWVGKSFAITAGLVIWILLQPNLSTSIVIFVIWFSMLFINGLPMRFVLIFGFLAIGAFIFAFPFLENYQQQRILSFLFPDPNARHGNDYNVEQALITIGSGGWFGMGYGHGTQVQLRFLKVRHTDFIFAAIAEEFGFVGTVIVVALLVFVVIRCLRAAHLSSDVFGSNIAFGFAVLIVFQSAVNIGVNLRVIPVTGLTLPFISYGGSSLLSLMLGIGLVESILLRQKSLSF